MSTKSNRQPFWRGFGSIVDLMPKRKKPHVRIEVFDNYFEAADADIRAAWADVGIHLQGAMDELQEERQQKTSAAAKRTEHRCIEVASS